MTVYLLFAVLTALNEIRLVCPVASVSMVTGAVSTLLVSVTSTLADYHTTAKTSMTSTDSQGWSQLCLAVKNILLPYIQVRKRLVLNFFPHYINFRSL